MITLLRLELEHCHRPSGGVDEDTLKPSMCVMFLESGCQVHQRSKEETLLQGFKEDHPEALEDRRLRTALRNGLHKDLDVSCLSVDFGPFDLIFGICWVLPGQFAKFPWVKSIMHRECCIYTEIWDCDWGQAVEFHDLSNLTQEWSQS